MKLKGKKATPGHYVTDDMSDALHKKLKKSSTLPGNTKDAAAVLITSSVQKKRKEANLVVPTRTCIGNKGPGVGSQNDECAEDVGHDLRLAFSDIDGSLTEQKETSVLTSHASILESIFSPVFHLFKGLNGEAATNHEGNGEQNEGSKQKTDAVVVNAGTDDAVVVNAGTDAFPQGMNKRFVGSCFSDSAIIDVSGDGKTAGSCPEATDNGTSLHEKHFITITSTPDEEPFGSQIVFNVVDDCIGWSLVDERDLYHVECMEENLMDSDGTSLYLAAQQTKSLECSSGREKGKTAPDEDGSDDFDPYLFIKHLPDLSEVVSPCRPMLLPRQTRRCPPVTLVLDLDETLVHSTLEHCDDADFTFPVSFNHQEHTVYVHCRPHLQMFLEQVAQMFEIIVFTASQCVYAEQLLNVLDPRRKVIRHRLYRDSCVFVEGNYMKDLTVLGRDLAKVAIVDNSPQAFGFQIDNGIPIESWFDDRSDKSLIDLLPFLETLVGVDDVRPVIARRFNLRQKIAAATDHPPPTNQGDPFERHP